MANTATMTDLERWRQQLLDEFKEVESEEIIRVFRIIEYVGPRKLVEHHITKALHGEREITHRDFPGICTIKAATLGVYPEIMQEKKGTT